MSKPPKRHQVFLSSTYRDLKAERLKLHDALLRDQYIVAGMEMFGADSRPPWQVIQRELALTDYYLLIIAGRYGSPGPGRVSYTEAEYDSAVEKGIPVLAFIVADLDKLPSGQVERTQKKRKALSNFQEKVKKAHTVEFWDSSDDLVRKVSSALLRAVRENDRPGWTRGESPARSLPSMLTARPFANARRAGAAEMIQRAAQVFNPSMLSDKAKSILLAIGDEEGPDADDLIWRLELEGGELLRVGNQTLMKPDAPRRERVAWDAALKELRERGLASIGLDAPPGTHTLTHQGYSSVDQLLKARRPDPLDSDA